MGIYIGNLPCDVTEEQIGEFFSDYGSVKKVQILSDQKTNHSMGFALVYMEAHTEEMSAIRALNGSEWLGRDLVVKGTRTRIDGQPKPPATEENS
ncbi:MAG: RNA recognition motif domain-containing protein [Microcoleaceae cyanobacterium]